MQTSIETQKKLGEAALALACELINRESITPNDAGCQTLLAEHLTAMGFAVKTLPVGDVQNMWARRGQHGPLLAFSGHTDVVPSGPLDQWKTPPFMATVNQGTLYGRGAADMKAALAAMIVACRYFLEEHPQHRGSIGFMATSDEEGPSINGTAKIVEYLQQQDTAVDWCVIGEASSNQQVGDVVKIGRRGSLHGMLQVFGKQGHIAYPHLAENPIHRSFKALDKLTQIDWDVGNEFFTPTTMQIYYIKADTGASNVIPGILAASFNFRFSPASTVESLQQRVYKTLDDHDLNYTIQWNCSSEPFLSRQGELFAACKAVIEAECGISPAPSTTGGTSDGRFIAKLGCELLELGVRNHTIHQVNEHIRLDDLTCLTSLYLGILKRLLG